MLRGKKIYNIAKWIIGLSISLLIITEIILRFHYGLCDAVLMRADDDYEYIAQPSQCRKRFGRKVIYNSHSMRNEALRPRSIRILCLGDSILNGGTLIDQSKLATTILSQKLSRELAKDVQVMNVSAGSWGPDNCLAWLNKNGDFGAKAIILVVSSHDVHDTMTFVPVVGRLKSYPSRQHLLAIFELCDRYIFPKSTIFHRNKSSIDDEFRREHHIETTNVAFNPGFQGILDYARMHDIPFAIYLHATKQELATGTYDKDGQSIIAFCQHNNVSLIQDLGNGLSPQCIYKNDYLHYSEEGQALMSELLMTWCQEILLKEQ